MKNLLPELWKIICHDVNFSLVRSINKEFKFMADEIEITKEDPIIITKKDAIKYLNSWPEKITLCRFEGYGISPNDLFLNGLYKPPFTGECSLLYNKMRTAYLNKMEHIMNSLVSPFHREAKNNNYIIIPCFKMIEFTILLHPLSYNPRFLSNKIYNTLINYVNIVKDLNQTNAKHNMGKYLGHCFKHELHMDITNFDDFEYVFSALKDKIKSLY